MNPRPTVSRWLAFLAERMLALVASVEDGVREFQRAIRR
jgi:hypothetical protein